MTQAATQPIAPRAGGILQSEQVLSRFNHLLARTDTDEVLTKAGLTRADLQKMTYDPDIDQALDARAAALHGNDFTLSPSDGKVAEFIFAQLSQHLDSILDAAMGARLYGYDVSELVWISEAQQAVTVTRQTDGAGLLGGDLDGLLEKDNAHYRYELDGKPISQTDYQNLFNQGQKRLKAIVQKPLDWFTPTHTGLIWHSETGQIDLANSPYFAYKYLYLRHKPSHNNPRGKALLSRIYWLWYFKTNGWRFWAKYLERFGSPLLIGKSDAQTQEEMNQFAHELISAHHAGVFAVGQSESVEAIGANGTGEAFACFDEVLKNSITKYLLGQTLTSGTGNVGSYALGQIHQDQQEIIFASDRKFAKKAVQNVINLLCQANGYPPPVFEWVSKRGLQAERAARDKELTAQGVQFTRAYYADMYDLLPEHFALVDSASDGANNSTNASVGAYQAHNAPYIADSIAHSAADCCTLASAPKADNTQDNTQAKIDALADLQTSPFATTDVLKMIKTLAINDNLTDTQKRDELASALARLAIVDDSELAAVMMAADVYGLASA